MFFYCMKRQPEQVPGGWFAAGLTAVGSEAGMKAHECLSSVVFLKEIHRAG